MVSPLLESALYWAVYGTAIVIGVPVALALLFGVLQTAKWFLKGGKTNPHAHGKKTSASAGEGSIETPG